MCVRKRVQGLSPLCLPLSSSRLAESGVWFFPVMRDICNRGLNAITEVRWPRGPRRVEHGVDGWMEGEGRDGEVTDGAEGDACPLRPHTITCEEPLGLSWALSLSHFSPPFLSFALGRPRSLFFLPSFCPVCFRLRLLVPCPLPGDAMFCLN